MTKRDRRLKASDVFREANFLFARKASFGEAFPTVEDIRIDVEIGYAVSGNVRHTYTRANLPGEYIDCDNSLCYNGGFSIGDVLRSMVQARERERQGSALCRGYEGSPKGRRKYRECLNFFRYTVQLTYKEEDSDPETAVRGQ